MGIVDYGSGNIASLRASLLKIGYRPHMLSCAEDFETAKVIVIPGVGAFPQAMEQIIYTGLSQPILDAHKQGKRIVGICVGMQILAQKGFEIKTEGLGLIDGYVQQHPDGLQVGWMLFFLQMEFPEIKNKEFYFNHSYHLVGPVEQVLYSCRSRTQSTKTNEKEMFLEFSFTQKKVKRRFKFVSKVIQGELS